MRSQADRDEQTLSIATALVVFVVVMVAGGTGLWLLSSVADLGDEAMSRVALSLVVVACGLTVAYLVRQRQVSAAAAFGPVFVHRVAASRGSPQVWFWVWRCRCRPLS